MTKCEAAARLFDERQKALYGLDPPGKVCCSWFSTPKNVTKKNIITGETVTEIVTVAPKKNKTRTNVVIEQLPWTGYCQLFGGRNAKITYRKASSELDEDIEKKRQAVLCIKKGEIWHVLPPVTKAPLICEN